MKMVILFIVLINLVNGQNPDEICYVCQDGYYFETAEGTNKNKCTKCPSTGDYVTCSKCNSATECTQCATTAVDGFYYTLIGGKCVKCEDTNCAKCSAAGTGKCSECATGFTKTEGNTCIKCADNCQKDQCTANNKCTTCATGFYKVEEANADKCLSCLNTEDPTNAHYGCAVCSAADTCTTCDTEKGYFKIEATGKCIKCDPNCNGNKCTENGKCTECATGYYKFVETPVENQVADGDETEGTCIKCDDATNGMAGCATCTSGTECTTCSSGLPKGHDNDSGKDTCQSCDAHCTSGCTTKLADKCDSKCAAHWYLDSDNTCKECPANCNKCDNVHDKCDSASDCDTGFGLSTDGQCVQCSAGCKDHQCTVANKCNANQCIADKYYYANEKCESCTSSDEDSKLFGCDECNDANTCTKCETTAVETTIISGKCEQCAANCKKCSTAPVNGVGECDEGECDTGYYFYTYKENEGEENEVVHHVCERCATDITGCAECSDKNTCTKCSTGYYLDETTHKCKLCNNKNEGTVATNNHCSKCTKDPEPPAPQDDSSVMVSIVLGLIALIALF
jgi:proprotein convertase subtilisin/kexin type 5